MILSPSVHTSDGDSEPGMNPGDQGYDVIYDDARLDLVNENKRRLLEQRWNRYRQDHHKACGGALNPIPAEPFNLLGLPLEIRNKIYDITLGRQVAVKQDSTESNGPINARINKVRPRNGPIDVRIFAVSRQVHAEALEVFYQVNTFAVCDPGAWTSTSVHSQINKRTSTTSYGPDPKNAHLDPLSNPAR